MKKILTILTSCSAAFLVSAGVVIVNKNNVENKIYLNKKKPTPRQHKIENGVLKEVGYYVQGNRVRIHTITSEVHTIDADLPEEVNSLRSAFVGNNNDVKWNRKWDTSNIIDMNSTFYGMIWFNNDAIKDWNVSNVTDMGEMFAYTKSFNHDLSKWDVTKVKNFEKMFEGTKEYNNGDQPLKWGDKLKNADNMQGMFNKAEKFTHSLSDWKPDKYVVYKNFGIDDIKQPKWKTEPPKVSTTPKPNSEPKSAQDALPKENNSITSTVSPKNNENTFSIPNITTPTPMEKENISNETTKINNNDNKRTRIYKIPSARTNTIKSSKSSNTGAIVGSVLGTFTILGAGAGVGYYYRSPLKNSYFKSKDWIKDKLSKIKSK
ncbi:BspA family leucine-rich repeat surface protein [Mycoplasma feriruminatoris]|uniref:Myrrcad domain-containing protein n=1 Tax=Mycoplasma feriruminatoris TaxID=1179777 RepID=A0AAQ3DNJ7_9MOLU|nr:BspA family leucine-rich repeat surface protein [Mycoplasma feriruminatoris]WFQ94926.1 Myrrcad domain-containing protein [Mycoplasma feriruminatoris]